MRKGLVALALVSLVAVLTAPVSSASVRHRWRYVMQEDTDRNAPGACSADPAGDFDHNGTSDLAIGTPGESFDGVHNAGVVYVLYGANGSSGLTATGATGVPAVQSWSMKSPGLDGPPKGNERFGRCLTTADLDGDGFSDLVVGVPGQTVNGAFRAGAVYVIFGSRNGLSPTQPAPRAAQKITMASLGIAPVQGFQDFGSSLATGDYNKDGFIDLAVGAPLRNLGDAKNAGATVIVYGGANGLGSGGSQMITQGDIGANPSGPENGDFMGSSLASGDLNGDGYSDLAIGSPGENLGPNNGVVQAGAVDVVYGGPDGLVTATAQRWTQDDTGVFPSQSGANFGWAVNIGELNDDPSADLAVSAPFQNINGVENAGSVTMLQGSPAGVTANGAKLFDEDTKDIGLQKDAYFGASLVLADFDNKDASDDFDLAVGVPGRNADGVVHSGAVDMFFSEGNTGPGGDIHQITQDSPGVPNSSEPDDHFGLAMSVGDYNHDDPVDLAVAAPHEVINGDAGGESAGAGAVTVLYNEHPDHAPSFAQFWSENSPGMPGHAEDNDWFGRCVI